jgi:large subunit ribosomal protein L18
MRGKLLKEKLEKKENKFGFMKKRLKKLYLQKKKRYLKKIVGNNLKPRLSIFKSQQHIYAQIIDDNAGCTISSYSTLKLKSLNLSKTKAAYAVGVALAQLALLKNVTQVCVDRGNKNYYGRINHLAEGARHTGLIL